VTGRALLISCARYGAGEGTLPDVRGALQDAWVLRRALTDPSIGLFGADALTVVQDPTGDEIVERLETFVGAATRNESLLIYFSGHGLLDLPTGEFYWAASDTSVESPAATAVPASVVRVALNRCASSSVVLLLDCCHGGALDAGIPADPYAGYGRYVISATRAGQIGADVTDRQERASPFTAALVDALEHATDRDNDGYVDVVDVYDHVARIMSRRGEPAPLYRFDGAGYFPLARRPLGRTSAPDGGSDEPVLLADEVTALDSTDHGFAAIVLRGTTRATVAIVPDGKARSVEAPPDAVGVAWGLSTFAVWSTTELRLYSGGLEPLAHCCCACTSRRPAGAAVRWRSGRPTWTACSA
jgi:hypothetical protein